MIVQKVLVPWLLNITVATLDSHDHPKNWFHVIMIAGEIRVSALLGKS